MVTEKTKVLYMTAGKKTTPNGLTTINQKLSWVQTVGFTENTGTGALPMTRSLVPPPMASCPWWPDIINSLRIGKTVSGKVK